MAAVLMNRLMYFARRVLRGLRRRLFPRPVYRKVPMHSRVPMRHAEAAPAGQDWRDRLRTIEVDDARALASELFERRFALSIPVFPRHFVLLYSAGGDTSQQVVAYVHQTRFDEVYLTGGLCVDERAYRSFPKWLFARVREEGGLATLLMKDSFAMLADGHAVFGHVGDLRSRQATLRAGYADTEDAHVMVRWRNALSDAEKQRLVARVVGYGPF
jgi:hypothetical protein